jgi:glycosyltransferase involved in cell wall biosynthesis
MQLQNRAVIAYSDVSTLDKTCNVTSGLSKTRPFMIFESGVRRLQRGLRLPYFAFFDTFRFYEACMRFLPGHDLCHEHNGLFCVGAALACRRLGIPYILTFSADPLYERALGGRPLRGLHRLVAGWEARFTYRLADKIICVSEPARRHLAKTWQVDLDKIVVMPNGVDLLRFRPDYDPQPVRAELALSDGPVVGFVGGFQHWHGLDRLVESFAAVLAEYPHAMLLLVGDGRARPAVESKIAELGLESSVIITGLVSQERVPEMLAVIDVAVIPYPKLPRELWFSPLKLYEYMAAGKAIVASRSGQIAEVIEDGHNGLLVEAGNVADLTRATLRLLGNPAERARLGRNAHRQASEQHSWATYIERLEQIYLSVRHRTTSRYAGTSASL